MPDVLDELTRFGRWLDTEIEERVDGVVSPWAAAPPARRRPLVAVAALTAAAALVVLFVATRHERPDPAIAPATTTSVPTTTTTVAPTTTSVAGSTPSTAPPVRVTSSAPSPAAVSASSVVVASTVASTRPPSSTPPAVAPTALPTAAAEPTAPFTVAPTTTLATTAPPATTAAVPTTAASTCGSGRRSLGGRNTVLYQVCAAGLSLTQALPAPGWSIVSPVAVGPPTITVTFTNGSTSVTCTLRPLGSGLVDTSDC